MKRSQVFLHAAIDLIEPHFDLRRKERPVMRTPEAIALDLLLGARQGHKEAEPVVADLIIAALDLADAQTSPSWNRSWGAFLAAVEAAKAVDVYAPS